MFDNDLTPEQVAQMQQSQQQNAGGGQPPLDPMQQQQLPMEQEPTLEEQKAEARTMLGVDEMQKQLNIIQENARMTAQVTRKDLMKKKYEISGDDLDTELAKIKETDPVWYEQMLDSDVGMEQVAKGMRANTKPTNVPDDVLDSGGGGGGEGASDSIAKVKKGGLKGDNMFMTLGEMQLS